MAEYKDLYDKLKNIYPNYAEEILKGLFFINDGLRKTKESIGNIPYKVLREKNNLETITEMEDVIDHLLKAISDINLDINIETNIPKTIQNKNEIIDNEKSNDDETNIPIIGNEFYKIDFTGTKPVMVRLLEEEKTVTSWKDVFFFVCETLASLDIDIFSGFVHNSEFRGRTRWYFSYNETQISTPELINNTHIYAEKNLPANVIRDILIKMFRKYSIGTSDFQIYLRSGYRSKRSPNKEKEDNDKLTKFIVDTMKPADNRKQQIVVNQHGNRKLDEFMGTKSHIGYVKMEEDHKRTKNRCIFYDKDLSCCTCNKSPYLNNHCGNISHCDFYEEKIEQEEKSSKDKELSNKTSNIREIIANDIIYVVKDQPKGEDKVCPHCNGRLKTRKLSILDKTDNVRIPVKGYECMKCHDQFSPYSEVHGLRSIIGFHSLGSKIY